jgi:hypothetical protein
MSEHERGAEYDRGALASTSVAHGHGALASTSVVRHLMRGAIGFGLIGAALALTPSHGPAALLLVAPGMVALRGCPTCWIVGLIETISAGRLRRACTDAGCTLAQPERQV